jgi:guanylate kinase
MTEKTYSGSLFVVSAPSGAGKSSLVSGLLKQDPGIGLSISHTTRAPRPGEQNGREYHFVDQAHFEEIRQSNGFLEYAEVHGNWYGTSLAWVRSKMAADEDVLLEIDWQGAEQVMKLIPEAVAIFILPPSMNELERRLRGRGTDSEDVIAKRLAAASTELARAHLYDYVILNDDFNVALRELASIVVASRCRFRQQVSRRGEQLKQFGL